MRIIAGLFRGRQIKEVLVSTTRSTSDMIRSMVFNTLFKVEGSVLDLYAGSGAYALEALSRGSNYGVFNDINYQAYTTILTNVKNLGLDDKTEVYNLEAKVLLPELKKKNKAFDYIFLDPPYNFTISEFEENLILELLKPNGFIIYETHRDADIKVFKELFIYKIKTQGIKKITFFKKVIE
jgi:16S rRNA (guanine(966)-N(2))-methyltransferase RsmD